MNKPIRLNIGSFIWLEFILLVGVSLFTVLEQPSLSSLCFKLTIAVAFVILLLQVKSGYMDAMVIVFAFVSLLNVLLNSWFSDEAVLNFAYWNKWIFYCVAFVFFYVASTYDADAKIIKIVETAPIIMGLIFIWGYNVLGVRTTYGGGIVLGFGNPNKTATWLLHTVLYGVYGFVKAEKYVLKIAYAAFCVLCIQLLFLTKNRASLVALLAFACLFCYGLIISKKKLPKWLLACVLIFPLLFAGIYQTLVEAEWFNKLFSFLVSDGKPLSSRSSMWEFAFQKFGESWLIGNYAGISEGTGMSQMHNTHLDLLCSFGIIPFVFFFHILYRVASSCAKKVETAEQLIAICAFLGVLMFGIFEAGLFTGCSGVNFLTGGFLLLAKKYEKIEEGISG